MFFQLDPNRAFMERGEDVYSQEGSYIYKYHRAVDIYRGSSTQYLFRRPLVESVTHRCCISLNSSWAGTMLDTYP